MVDFIKIEFNDNQSIEIPKYFFDAYPDSIFAAYIKYNPEITMIRLTDNITLKEIDFISFMNIYNFLRGERSFCTLTTNEINIMDYTCLLNSELCKFHIVLNDKINSDFYRFYSHYINFINCKEKYFFVSLLHDNFFLETFVDNYSSIFIKYRQIMIQDHFFIELMLTMKGYDDVPLGYLHRNNNKFDYLIVDIDFDSENINMGEIYNTLCNQIMVYMQNIFDICYSKDISEHSDLFSLWESLNDDIDWGEELPIYHLKYENNITFQPKKKLSNQLIHKIFSFFDNNKKIIFPCEYMDNYYANAVLLNIDSL
jgi:hypothetical protein